MKNTFPSLQLGLLFLSMLILGGLFYITEKTIREVNLLEVEVSNQEENIARLQGLKTSLPVMTPQIENFLGTLPRSEEDVALFASTLEQEARTLGLVIAFQFDDFPEPVDVSGQNIIGLGSEITLEGSFQGSTTFLARLSALPYFFKTDKITILKHETKDGVKTIITGSLMMSVERSIP